MATTKKYAKEKLRKKYLDILRGALETQGETVLTTGANEFAVPCVDEDGDDQYITVTVKVPSGSRDGDPYDGYAMAEDYQMKTEAKAEAAAEREKKKQAKIARDEKARAAKAEAKKQRLMEAVQKKHEAEAEAKNEEG